MRRSMLLWLFLVAVLIPVGGLGLPFLADAMAPAPTLKLPIVDLAPGEARLQEGVWIARQQDGSYRTFLNLSPHHYHPITWLPEQAVFAYPQQAGVHGPHDEQFHLNGACASGPCGGPLYEVATTQEGEYLVVSPYTVTGGGPPGQKRPDQALISQSLKHR